MAEKLHIAVLRGGQSTEYEASLKSGHAVTVALEHIHLVQDIFIDKRGVWHRRGVPVTPEKALHGIDVAFIALHGTYGEDGQIQRTLTSLGIPYTGSDAFASGLAIDRAKAKEVLKKIPQVRMPLHHVVSHYEGMHYAEKSHEIFNFFGPPYVVKALHGGTHNHLRIAKTLHDLPKAIHHVATRTNDDVLVEQYEKGVHVSCVAIEMFRGKAIYTTIPAEEHFVDGVHTSAHAPARITAAMKKHIEDATEYIHDTLQFTHVSEMHFVVNQRTIFFLNASSSPLLTTASPLLVSLEAVGSSLTEYCEHLISQARTTKRYA
ncbi:MAG: D-alanine--D-alanine ligase [Candidatus Parcubacteria bacterium]|jgi:D-alanine-D-alanine ligase